MPQHVRDRTRHPDNLPSRGIVQFAPWLLTQKLIRLIILGTKARSSRTKLNGLLRAVLVIMGRYLLAPTDELGALLLVTMSGIHAPIVLVIGLIFSVQCNIVIEPISLEHLPDSERVK